jgi:hypothetical protein
MELFPKDSVLELTTKNLGSSPSFVTITHTTMSAKRFGSSRILMIAVAAEFCFWTEQQLNESSHLGLGLAEAPEVPNTKLVSNSLSFPMVYKTAPNR